MSDSRWTDVDRDIDDALRHFGMALRIFAAGGFDAADLEGYKSSSSFMRGVAAGYTCEARRSDEPYAGFVGAEIFRRDHVFASIILEDNSHIFVGESGHVCRPIS